jgi:acyl phosphate:glycerol-3-phosphate acyltransferase
MQLVLDIGIILIAYVFGSIPFGLLIVKLKTGKDIREVESGRTGGTNAMRAAGFWAGFVTAMLDVLKGAAAVWIAQALSPENDLVHVIAAVGAILGHNYSVFLTERDENGRLRMRGGAGAMPALGGAMGFWVWSFPIILGLGALVLFTLGMASVATMTVGLCVIIVFAIRASMGLMPWIYVLYGVIAELLLIWALRPNIQKLLAGNERVISMSLAGRLRAKREQQKAEKSGDGTP